MNSILPSLTVFSLHFASASEISAFSSRTSFIRLAEASARESIMNIINNAVKLLKAQGADKAEIGLILGSGLGDYAESLENKPE